jgi:hypothetical protein
MCLGALGPGAEGGRVRPIPLGDMVARAGRIFVGRCTGRTTSVDEATRLPVAIYTFAVTNPIKGVGRGQTTVRMPGSPDQPFFAGLPSFDVGEEALLILYPESGAGFSTPMGLDQGRFRIVADDDGEAAAVNGNGNDRLFDDVPPGLVAARSLPLKARGPVNLNGLVSLIRVVAAGSRP